MPTRGWSIAALLIALALAAAACSDDDAATGSTTFATAALDEEAAAAMVLLADTEALITAIDSGDIETVMSMVQASAPEPERLRFGFWAAWDFADYHDCEVITATGFGRRVDCILTFTDPVFRQFEPTDRVLSIYFWDDGVKWQFSGRSTYDAMNAYREFFEANEPDLYAATCVSDAYDQTVATENWFALIADCGAILQSKAADVAAWLDAGGTGE